MTTQWVPLSVSIVGNLDVWDYLYAPLSQPLPTRQKAIDRGMQEQGSDDFLLAEIEGDRLVQLAWMEESRFDADEASNAAAALGYSYVPQPAGELFGPPAGEWEQTAADQLPPASTTGSDQ